MTKGFIQLIVILILMLVIASLLGADLFSLYKNKALRTNFSIVWQGIEKMWNTYMLPSIKIIGSFLGRKGENGAPVSDGL